MKRPVTFLVVLLSAATVYGQPQPCNDPDTQDTCTVGAALVFYREAELRALGIMPRDAVSVDGQVTAAANEAADGVVEANRATTPPDAFAGRVHNSYQDFLNLFSFAINSIEESGDGRALTLRLNPLRDGAHVVGVTFTASKPSVAEAIQNALPDDNRTGLLAEIEGELDDLDDLTLAFSYSTQTLECADKRPRERCYGRSPSTYREILSHALRPILAAQPDPGAAVRQNLKQRLARLIQPAALATEADAFKHPFTNATDAATLRQVVRALAVAEARQTLASKQHFAELNLDVIPSMIDNQPQVALTASHRRPGPFGGANQTAISAELQYGPDNINALRAECGAAINDACLSTALQRRLTSGVSTTKWVVSVAATHASAFNIAELTLDAPVTGFTPVHLESAWDIVVKGQGGLRLTRDEDPRGLRGDLSLEGHWAEKGGMRTTNRWVAAATLTVPIVESVSVPVSITWANKPEFLDDEADKIGAHIGLSYRLPKEFSLFGR